MNILLIGSGGREHALAWKLAQSPLLDHLYIAPGNAGTEDYGENISIDPLNFKEVEEFVKASDVAMIIVGPEDPLVKGIADHFLKVAPEVMVIGPMAQAAQLEGSKDFAKSFMVRNGIPTAKYESFTLANLTEGRSFLNTLVPPYVLKASGLAAGKGVVIQPTLKEAEEELHKMLTGKFGEASEKVVIEEFLEGVECSVFALTDGQNYILLPEAKDYKRVGEGDSGLNTGGMGAVSPVPFYDAAFMHKVETRIIRPTVEGLAVEGLPYKGFLFFGIMNVDGEPYVIEYNCRLGDPETEVILPRLKNDLIELFISTWEGTLNQHLPLFDKRSAATVICVSGGYPGDYEKGKEISGLEKVEKQLVFHAGTTRNDDKVLSNGGRVLAFTTLSDSLHDALAGSYSALSQVSFDGMYCRKDIGKDLL